VQDDRINISVLPDSSHWLTSETNISLDLAEDTRMATLQFDIPGGLPAGAACRFLIDAVSGKDPTKRDRDSLFVVVYEPLLADVVVLPDTVRIEAGQEQEFFAVGIDSKGYPFDIKPVWSATGGTIDTAGSYTAGQTTGSYRPDNRSRGAYSKPFLTGPKLPQSRTLAYGHTFRRGQQVPRSARIVRFTRTTRTQHHREYVRSGQTQQDFSCKRSASRNLLCQDLHERFHWREKDGHSTIVITI